MALNKKLAVLMAIAILVPVSVALFPNRNPGNVDLGNPIFEAAIFGICMLLWVTARIGRWNGDAYFVFRSNVWDTDLHVFRRNIVAGGAEFLLLAGVLQFLKIFIPNRQPSIEKFFFDAASIVVIGVICFIVIVFIVKPILDHRSIDKTRTG